MPEISPKGMNSDNKHRAQPFASLCRTNLVLVVVSTVISWSHTTFTWRFGNRCMKTCFWMHVLRIRSCVFSGDSARRGFGDISWRIISCQLHERITPAQHINFYQYHFPPSPKRGPRNESRKIDAPQRSRLSSISQPILISGLWGPYFQNFEGKWSLFVGLHGWRIVLRHDYDMFCRWRW